MQDEDDVPLIRLRIDCRPDRPVGQGIHKEATGAPSPSKRGLRGCRRRGDRETGKALFQIIHSPTREKKIN